MLHRDGSDAVEAEHERHPGRGIMIEPGLLQHYRALLFLCQQVEPGGPEQEAVRLEPGDDYLAAS